MLSMYMYTGKGVASEVNLRERISHMPLPIANKSAYSGFEAQNRRQQKSQKWPCVLQTILLSATKLRRLCSLCFYMCLSFCPQGGVVSQHALQQGGVPAPGVGLWWGGVCSRRGSAPGGSVPGGVSAPGGYASGGVETPHPQSRRLLLRTVQTYCNVKCKAHLSSRKHTSFGVLSIPGSFPTWSCSHSSSIFGPFRTFTVGEDR